MTFVDIRRRLFERFRRPRQPPGADGPGRTFEPMGRRGGQGRGRLAQEKFQDFPLKTRVAKRHAGKMPFFDNLRLLRAPEGCEQV
jgi:hypothetical protein